MEIKNFWHRLTLVYQHSQKSSLGSLIASVPNFETIDDETLLTQLEDIYLPIVIKDGKPLLCPSCGKPMKDHSWVSSGYDSDNEWNTWGEEYYVCHNCHTEYIDDEWNIPEPYKATDKQISMANHVYNYTRIPLPPPTKKLLWKYINENLPKAKKSTFGENQ